MREKLTFESYVSAKELIRNLEDRIAEIESRKDFPPPQIESVVRSYRSFMKKINCDIEEFESHREFSLQSQLVNS